jgi:hypothetical protein
MKIVKNIPAYLLGIVFLVFGLNFFLHFMPTPSATPTGAVKDFMSAIYPTGFLTFVKVIEVGAGLLLLINKTRALALILIAPIVVGITAYEVFIAHQPGLGVILLILNAIGIIVNKHKYLPIVQ